MRIVFLGNGLTGYLDAQYRELATLGHQLLIVQPGSPDLAVGAMRDTQFGDLGVSSYADYLPWETEPSATELIDRVLAFGPDAVIMTAWNFADSYRAVMKAVGPGVVRILVMDNLWRSAPRQWLGRLVSRWYVGSVADVAMVPSERSEQYARMLGFGPSQVIRGSLSADTALFTTPTRSAEEIGSRRRFIYVGRLVEHKGADVLAEAWREYRDMTDDPWDLDVVGLGPLDHLLRPLPGVTMHGFIPPAQVAEMMRTASCAVVPSRIEPYGVIVHEAAASGLPILCTDFAGAASGFVQDHANGWIVPANDASQWAAALARMSSTSAERLAAMSDVSRSIAARNSPAIWAANLAEQITRRKAS